MAKLQVKLTKDDVNKIVTEFVLKKYGYTTSLSTTMTYSAEYTASEEKGEKINVSLKEVVVNIDSSSRVRA